ncbi:ABC transporter substrate-binding protein [Streptomyces sp. NBC_00988]|uniref:ABC transporter substrate-binding protein n=1 Tax=Streptomyces sp. NBC_00988 TaxID=2903704 RepID=UPI0038649F22|nr:ABC transporter substrate-binding protein [Streptomyces sp. NBC_00988]
MALGNEFRGVRRSHVDKEGNATPWLATSWKFTDTRTLELKLRTGVKFTDGTAFDVNAVVANLEYARKNATNGSKSVLAGVKSVTAVDATTVRIALTSPNPDLPVREGVAFAIGSAGYMASPKALKKPESLRLASDGTGPYQLDTTRTVAGQKYVLKRNPDYWSPKTYSFSQVAMKIVADRTAQVNAVRSGGIDVLSVSPGTSVAGLTVQKGAAPMGQGIALMDVEGKISEPLGDVRVRQALNYAIDRETVIKTVLGGDAEINPSIPANSSSAGWTRQLANTYTYDPAKARKLLQEAGYGSGFDLKVLSTPAADGLVQALAGYLRKIGVKVTIEDHISDLLQQATSGKWAAGNINLSVTGSTFTDVTLSMTPGAFFNFQHVDDPKITALLAEAGSATTEAARNSAYRRLLDYTADQAWYIIPGLLRTRIAYNAQKVELTNGSAQALALYDIQPAD